MNKMYIIYDGRARYDVDSATVLDTADSFEEAIQASANAPEDSVVFAYDIDNNGDLINGKLVEY
jgi:hypothetical protein